MKQQHQQKIWTILFCTAAFVAMLLASVLRAAEVPSIYVVFLSVVLSGGLSLIIAIELVMQRLERPKR